MRKPRKIKPMQDMPVTMVGDGGSPDVFFVTDQGVTVTITTHFGTAYNHWRRMARSTPKRECALEDRRWGCICAVEPVDETPGARLVTLDDSHVFCKRHKQHSTDPYDNI